MREQRIHTYTGTPRWQSEKASQMCTLGYNCPIVGNPSHVFTCSKQGCSPRDRGLGLESTRDRFFPVLVLVLVSKGRSWIFLKTDRVSGRLFVSFFLQINTEHAWVTLYSVTWCLLNAILSCKLDINQCLWSFLMTVMFAWTVYILFHTAICGLGLGLGTVGLDYKSGFYTPCRVRVPEPRSLGKSPWEAQHSSKHFIRLPQTAPATKTRYISVHNLREMSSCSCKSDPLHQRWTWRCAVGEGEG